MIKWKLFMTTLPYVVVIDLIDFSLGYFFNFEGLIDFSEVGLVLTGGIFLIGFMLAGTMTDYKESEKIPAELAATLETMEETISMANFMKPAVDVNSLRKTLFTLSTDISSWFDKKVETLAIFNSLNKFQEQGIKQLEEAGATTYAARLLGELSSLRKIITRIGVISRTGFIAYGYALLEVLISLIILLLIISKFKSALAEYILITFVSLIYIYMYRLIKDIDDPFEYSEHSAGGSEIPLFPLDEYIERAKTRIK